MESHSEKTESHDEAVEYQNDHAKSSSQISVVMRLIVIVIGLAFGAYVLLYVSMFTAFAGSSHNAPQAYIAFLALTQVIPIIAGSISWLILIFTCFSSEIAGKLFIVLACSIVCYCCSFLFIPFFL